MYVCMSACECACMYVRVYVCMCMYVCMYVCMFVCMFVCKCIYECIYLYIYEGALTLVVCALHFVPCLWLEYKKTDINLLPSSNPPHLELPYLLINSLLLFKDTSIISFYVPGNYVLQWCYCIVYKPKEVYNCMFSCLKTTR